MSLILIVFGLVDVAAGLALWKTPLFPIHWIATIGWLMLVKGAYSVSLAWMNGIKWDVLGWIDLIASVALLASWTLPFFWVFPLAKGAYSLLTVYTIWNK